MDQRYRRIISGEANGILPAILRGMLLLAAWLYGAAVALRNLAFDVGWKKAHRLPVPVIAVGNITVGGTGKTPTVVMIVRELERLGKNPAILTRGYGAKKGEVPDEVQVLRTECPSVPVIVNPDRVAGGHEAINKFGADVLVMDDGFQHRRLARDLNVVLIDATAPLGIPGLLPRGTWREPPESLSRADIIMLTRVEQVTPELAELAGSLLTQWTSPRSIFQQSTRVTGVFDSSGNPILPASQRVIPFAGIGNPNGFLHTVRTLGFNAVAACWFDDHHHYRIPEDFAAMERLSHSRKIDAWITTLKDWVKLSHTKPPVPIWHVRIEHQITGPAAKAWRVALAEAVKPGISEYPRPDQNPA